MSDAREHQRDRIYWLLMNPHPRWVPLPEILALGVAQYGARVLELRRKGHRIENCMKHMEDGAVHSWFCIVPPGFTLPPKPWEPHPTPRGQMSLGLAVEKEKTLCW